MIAKTRYEVHKNAASNWLSRYNSGRLGRLESWDCCPDVGAVRVLVAALYKVKLGLKEGLICWSTPCTSWTDNVKRFICYNVPLSVVIRASTAMWCETGAAGARVSSPGRCHSPDKTSPQSILQFLQLNNFPHGAGAGCRNLDYVFIKGLSWKLFPCPVSGIPQLSLNKLWQTECCTQSWEYRVHLSHLSAISRFQMWLRGRPELRSYF